MFNELFNSFVFSSKSKSIQNSALIANSDPNVENTTVPFCMLKRAGMPVSALNLLEEQVSISHYID